MKHLELDDILDVDRYEGLRDDYRARVMQHKQERRVSVGDRVTLVFEDRETIRYQVQEMARIEGLRDRDRVQHELDVYNSLMPGERELSATLFIEIPDLERIRPELDRLVGIDERVAIVLGDSPEEEAIVADFDETQLEDDRISAVHYLRFRLTPAQADRLSGSDRARLRIDHPAYRAEAELNPILRASLMRDLRDAPPVLLDPSAASATSAEPQILVDGPRVRALRPAQPAAPHHVVVESVEEVSLPEADPELIAETMALVQRFAREIGDAAGAYRIVGDGSPKGRGRLRWQILSPSGR